MGDTDAATRLLCVLGHPVSHSLSPLLHSAAINAAGLNAVYLAFDVTPAAFATAMDGLIAIGLMGANVTIPHKAAALAYADDATEEALFIGAANTLFWRDQQLWADNTDAVGLMGVLRAQCAVQEGDDVVIYGSGGAARAAAVAFGRLAAAVRVRARRPAAARELQELAREAGGSPPTANTPRIVVNATPLGRQGERLPADLMQQGRGQVALDLNYGPPSPFLTQARAAGAIAVDGTGMLVGQAEVAFERWTGMPPAEGVMAAVVR